MQVWNYWHITVHNTLQQGKSLLNIYTIWYNASLAMPLETGNYCYVYFVVGV